MLVWTAVSVAPSFAKDGNKLLHECTDALSHIENGYRSANERLLNFGYCLGYVLGVIEGYREGFLVLSMRVGMPSPPALCFPGGVPLEQVVRIVVNYLRAAPQQLHLSAGLSVITAIAIAFPCPGQPPPPQEITPSGAQPATIPPRTSVEYFSVE